jgi:glutathione S-transferase
MKLYSTGLSPYAARVRLAIYAKGLDIEIAPPAGGGLKSAEYLAINPIGKVPSLVLNDGTVIPESDTILEYLEDKFPQKPLRPAVAEDAARARLLARIGDLYVMTAGGALFGQMNPATRDQAAVDAAFAKLDDALAYLNVFLGEGPFALGATFSTADCALAPLLFFVGLFGRTFGKEDLLSKHPKVAAYGRHLHGDATVKKVYAEMQEGLGARARG